MRFSERLEEMLNTIGHVEHRSEILRFHDNAANWSDYRTEKYFNPILEKLFDKDFEFSERREQEMRRTCEELLLNSYSACKERDNLYIEFIAYIGSKGIVIHIKDEGKGFNFEEELRKTKALPNLPADQIILYDGNPHGRTGSLCLLKYANDFQYNEKGNELIVRFDL